MVAKNNFLNKNPGLTALQHTGLTDTVPVCGGQEGKRNEKDGSNITSPKHCIPNAFVTASRTLPHRISCTAMDKHS